MIASFGMERTVVSGTVEARLGALYLPDGAYTLRALAGAETGITGTIRARDVAGVQVGSDLTATGDVAARSIALTQATSQWLEVFGLASAIDGSLICPAIALEGGATDIMPITSVGLERTLVSGTVEYRLGAVYLTQGSYTLRALAGAFESGITGTIRVRTVAGAQIGSDLTATGELAVRSIAWTNTGDQWVEIFGLASAVDGTLICAGVTFETAITTYTSPLVTAMATVNTMIDAIVPSDRASVVYSTYGGRGEPDGEFADRVHWFGIPTRAFPVAERGGSLTQIEWAVDFNLRLSANPHDRTSLANSVASESMLIRRAFDMRSTSWGTGVLDLFVEELVYRQDDQDVIVTYPLRVLTEET